jgi:hypothetical protein
MDVSNMFALWDINPIKQQVRNQGHANQQEQRCARSGNLDGFTAKRLRVDSLLDLAYRWFYQSYERRQEEPRDLDLSPRRRSVFVLRKSKKWLI